MRRIKDNIGFIAKILVFLLVFGSCFYRVSTVSQNGEDNAEKLQEVPGKIVSDDARPADGGTGSTQISEMRKLYQKLFRRKREAHFEAIDTIIKLDKYEKQHKMITILLEKLFKIMMESQVKLMSLGFTPGDPFPTNETTRDAFSNVVENTAFFGDMLLRLPDIVHDVMKKNREWDLLIKWGVGFCNMSNVLENKELKLLNLMSQELGIIDKDENYVNPYKEENIRLTMKRKQETEESAMRLQKKGNKKKKKEKKRGPRLSGEL